MTNFTPAKLSPHDCTVCHLFQNIEFLSDTQKSDDVEVVWVTCEKKGKFTNGSLYICKDFEYDEEKPILVELVNKSWMFREYKRVKCQEDLSLENLIYDLIVRSQIIDYKGAPLSFIVNRLHLEKGFSKMELFRASMSMCERNMISKKEYFGVKGVVYLVAPTMLVTIAELKSLHHKSRSYACEIESTGI